MILELADLRILPGRQAGFELAVPGGVDPVTGRAPGSAVGRIGHEPGSRERGLRPLFRHPAAPA